MIIRYAELKDLDDICRIYSERYDSHDASQIRYKEEDWKWYLEKGAAMILVLEVNGNIVGLALSYDMGLWGYMEHIVISEGHRGNGYARGLIEHTLAIGKSMGWKICEACYYEEISEMGEFFKRIGWEDGGISTRWVYKE